MKVLLVAPRFPYPLRDGLLIRMFNLLGQAAAEHKVTLASLAASPPSAGDMAEVQALATEVIVIPRRSHRLRAAANAAASLLGGRPFTIARYHSENLAAYLREADESGRFDIAHLHTIHMGQYAPLMRRTRTLLDTPDVVSEIWKLGRDTRRNPLMRLAVHTQYRAVLRYEPWVYSRADLVATVSEEDRSQVARVVGDERVRLLPNGVDIEYHRPMEVEVEPESMVFVGNMRWPPNADGAEWFCRSVLPQVLVAHPAAKLYLVGHAPGPSLKRFSGPAVLVTGTVPDVRPYVARAAVSLVPLRVGGGTRLKILEAMAMAKPVVSTSLGCQGLGARHGDNILIADGPAAFAQAVCRLFGSQVDRTRLGQAGREFVLDRYDWAKIGARLNAIYQELAAIRSGRQPAAS